MLLSELLLELGSPKEEGVPLIADFNGHPILLMILGTTSAKPQLAQWTHQSPQLCVGGHSQVAESRQMTRQESFGPPDRPGDRGHPRPQY